MINFIIPSIGRSTINYTLNSLVNQTKTNWNCFVGFDGKSEGDIDSNIIVDDSRIKYIYLKDKIGSEKEHHGNAGQVRNCIIDNIDNNLEWIGFVDDDDTLSKFYIEIFELEKSKHKFDCCVFRMRYDKNNEKVIPPLGMDYLKQNYVGISFCVNREFIKTKNIKFCNDNAEDFKFLKEICDNGGKIHISSHITYNVNGYQYYGQK